MKLTFESVDPGKKIALLNVGGPIQSAQMKFYKAASFWFCIRNSSCLTVELGCWSFLAFRLRLEQQHFLCEETVGSQDGTYTIGSLGPQAFGLGLEPHISSPGSPAC